MAENDLQKALAMLEYAAARRGLFLTVHALNKAKEVLKWELLGDRESALDVAMEPRVQKNTTGKSEPQN
jgi:hypothetical protein